jgi:hypothetical protein
LQADWLGSWDELQRQLEAATDEADRLELVAQWQKLWSGHLSFNYGAGHDYTYNEKGSK